MIIGSSESFMHQIFSDNQTAAVMLQVIHGSYSEIRKRVCLILQIDAKGTLKRMRFPLPDTIKICAFYPVSDITIYSRLTLKVTTKVGLSLSRTNKWTVYIQSLSTGPLAKGCQDDQMFGTAHKNSLRKQNHIGVQKLSLSQQKTIKLPPVGKNYTKLMDTRGMLQTQFVLAFFRTESVFYIGSVQQCVFDVSNRKTFSPGT